MSTKNIREPRMIFSTDYMHMAEAGELSKIVTIPAMTIAAGTSSRRRAPRVPYRAVSWRTRART